jgi:hypothetical protein
MQAMLGMGKLDIAELERAADGRSATRSACRNLTVRLLVDGSPDEPDNGAIDAV